MPSPGAESSHGPSSPQGDELHAERPLLARVRSYTRRLQQRFRLVVPGRELRDIPRGRMWIARKLDGELWFLRKHKGQVALISPSGRQLGGIPLTDEAATRLADHERFLAAGELYVPGHGARHELVQALSDPRATDRLCFAPFDLLEDDPGTPQQDDYGVRRQRLLALFGGSALLSPPESIESQQPGDVTTQYARWVETGASRGLVVWHSLGLCYTLKRIVTLDACVVAFSETIPAEVCAVTVALRHGDGRFQILATLSTGLLESERSGWHPRLAALQVESSYRLADHQGRLCRWVRPELVLELKCLDLSSREDDDRPVRRMAVDYDAEHGYSPAGLVPFVKLIHPVIVRTRNDKSPATADVGVEQVARIVPFANELRPARLQASETLSRRVWTRTIDGRRAVRKYVALATHKHAADPSHPPFVVHFSDFSPGRKTPLKTSLRVASSPGRLNALIAKWLQSNINQHWQEVGPAPSSAKEPGV